MKSNSTISQKEFSRKEFYDLVWSKPINSISKEYEITYHKLITICDQYDIPTPEMAYWSKLKHEKEAIRKPLPDKEGLSGNDPISLKTIISVSDLKKEIELKHPKELKVPEKLTKPCRLIKLAKDDLRKRKYLPSGITKGLNLLHMEFLILK